MRRQILDATLSSVILNGRTVHRRDLFLVSLWALYILESCYGSVPGPKSLIVGRKDSFLATSTVSTCLYRCPPSSYIRTLIVSMAMYGTLVVCTAVLHCSGDHTDTLQPSSPIIHVPHVPRIGVHASERAFQEP